MSGRRMRLTDWSGKAHEERYAPMGFDFSQCWRRGDRQRGGFTVLELLLVIGIIILLVTLFFIGFKHVANSNRVQDTKSTLQTAATLFGNYDQATHLTKVPGWLTNFESAATMPTAMSVESLQLLVASHPVPPQIVIDTETVMATLTGIPDNQKIVGSLPQAKTVVELARTGDPTGTTYSAMLQDSWGNPIFFVFANGLAGVTSSGGDTYNSSTQYQRGNRVIYQGRIYTWINQTSGNSTPPITSPYSDANWGGLCSPDLRPFWVSAGPDGDLSKGDDNVYSFEQ